MRQSVARPVPCPNCAESMTLLRTIVKYGDTPGLDTFACKDCGVYYTFRSVVVETPPEISGGVEVGTVRKPVNGGRERN